ncbi:MAG: thioredoxin [Betaproteobacteria bacterium]
MIEISEAQFEREVIETSHRLPVLVDFWAPWCGPCRTLSPVLERLSLALQGEVSMVKVNADHAPKLSQRYGVRSIPMVLLFRAGRVVDQFTGAKPEAQIRSFIQPHLPRPEDADLVAARRLREQGDLEAAAHAFKRVLAVNPGHLAARSEWVYCLLESGCYSEAANAFEPLRSALHADPSLSDARIATLAVFVEAGQALQAARLAEGAEAASSREAVPNREAASSREAVLSREAAASPEALPNTEGTLEGRLLAAQRHMLASRWRPAIDLLLGILSEDRKFSPDRIRKSLLAIFALCPDQALVGQSRRRLSSLLN